MPEVIATPEGGETPPTEAEIAVMQGGDTPVDTPAEDTTDPIEKKARERGWKPESEFEEGAEKPQDFLSPNEFILKGKFIDKISKQNKSHSKEMDGLKAQIAKQGKMTEQLLVDSAKIEDRAVKEAIAKLRKEGREAVENGDEAKADKLDLKIDELQEKRLEEKKVEEEDKPDHKAEKAEREEIIAEYAKKNTWFKDDPDLNHHFTTQAKAIFDADNTIPFQEIMEKTDKWFKKEFKHRFENSLRDGSEAVGGGRTTKKGSSGWDGVPQDQKDACMQFISLHPGDEQYAKDMKQSYIDMNKKG